MFHIICGSMHINKHVSTSAPWAPIGDGKQGATNSRLFDDRGGHGEIGSRSGHLVELEPSPCQCEIGPILYHVRCRCWMYNIV